MNSPSFYDSEQNASMIENARQLQIAARDAGSLIQQISDFAKRNPRYEREARIRFPRGHIKPADRIRMNLRFVEDDNLRRNVSYALMTHEIFRWIVFSTDLSGQAREMMIKEAVCLLGNICESITVFRGQRGLGRNSGYRQRVARLQELQTIDDENAADLLWLWDKRNQEHLVDVPFREWNHYVIDDWYRATRSYRELRDSLLYWRGFEPD